MKVLILGVNGFIGNALAKKVLEATDWTVQGIDLLHDRVEPLLKDPRFRFQKANLLRSWEWADRAVAEADVVLPLVAIATPELYVRDPLLVFELDFEANLRVVRLCVRHRKRLVFPSTSEVYGMCPDPEFDEDRSPLVLGPIRKTRWIYAASKQLLDRVVWAYGEKEGLAFTLFRPFNWVGPHLDSIDPRRRVKSRALTEFIANLLEGKPMVIVGGGKQRRSFCDVEEGADCLLRILEDGGGRTNREIVNIGYPENEHSVEDLARMVREEFEERGGRPPETVFQEAETAYGEGYEDVRARRPSVEKARRLLGWEPRVPLRETVRRTVGFYWEQRQKGLA